MCECNQSRGATVMLLPAKSYVVPVMTKSLREEIDAAIAASRSSNPRGRHLGEDEIAEMVVRGAGIEVVALRVWDEKSGRTTLTEAMATDGAWIPIGHDEGWQIAVGATR